MKRFVILGIAAATIVGCTGKKNAVVTEDKGVLTKSVVAEEATVRLTEVFTSEIEPTRRTTSLPRLRAYTSTKSWSRWAIRCARAS